MVWPFRKKVPTGPPPPVNGAVHSFVAPAGSNDERRPEYPLVGRDYGWPLAGRANMPRHNSFTVPNSRHNPTYPTDAVTYAPRVGIELNSIPEQDRIWVHYLQPPPDQPAGKWYDRRNADTLSRARVEHLQGEEGWPVEEFENREQLNPNLFPPPPNRPTAYQSPSNFRFVIPTKPNGIRGPRELNGNHFSMATMSKSFPVHGMQPQRNFRNTYRIEPAPRDAANADMPPPPTVPAATYQSPSVPVAQFGKTYRLT